MILLLTLLCVGGWACAPSDGGDQITSAGDPLRVVTYNIRHGRGMDGVIDLERTAQVLGSLEPDLIGLQEVDRGVERSGRVDQAAELGRLLDMTPAFGAFMEYQGGHYGMAMLSRLPLARTWTIALPEGEEPRIALAAEVIRRSGDTIVAVNVHFDWIDDDRDRLAQAALLGTVLDTLSHPWVLLGDLNDEPGSRTLALLEERAQEATKGESGRFTFSTDDPRKEIDFVFVAPHSGWDVREARVVDERVASDHFPVLAVVAPVRPPFDWLVRGGTLVDGTGAEPRRSDVLIRDGLVAHVGPVDADTLTATETFDATGLVVAPGFIDPHAHGDPTETPDFDNFLAQGVTTIVLGQDGSGPDPASFSATLDAADAARPALNVAYLVGHNTIRRASGVDFGDPGAAGLERMRSLVEQALDAGAFGLSTGLEYTPGNRAGIEELTVVAEPVAAVDGVVMSHIRSEDADRIDASVAELLEQGRRSGARVHVSHAKIVLEDDPSAAERVLATLAAARADGVRVTADVYPYTASFTGISILFPDWARGPTPYADVVRDRRPELEAHLRARVGARNGPEATLFGSGPWSGLTLAEAAAREGRPFEDLLVELGPGGASAAYFVMDDAVMTRFLVDPHVAVSSDGSPTMSHPRGYGSVARVLSTFAGESEILTLEEVVRKMSSLPADILGLDDPGRVAVPRGTVQEGMAADLVVFDPAEVRDRATFEAPHTLAVGMRAVWVGGEPAWMDGAAAEGPGHGRALRRR